MFGDPELEQPVPTLSGNRRERLEAILDSARNLGDHASVDGLIDELNAAWEDGYRMGAASARQGPAVPGEPRRRSPQYLQGYRAATRAAIDWLHLRASEMNDGHARNLLHSAAFGLGVSRSRGKRDPATSGRRDHGGEPDPA